MKTNTVLQVIFAFFLGLVVVAFVGIGVNTFYPEPRWVDGQPDQYAGWQLTTGIVLLICATIILAVSLFLPEHQGVLSNGILLGGVFTMIYAVGMTVSSNASILRFVVVAIALAVTIAIGYLKFTRRRSGAPPAEGAGTVPVDVAERLAAVERKLDALGRALQG
ncbi:MAG TPA: hypothetical protein VFW55_08645 [Propionicimonas sp.]|nr:hypothetical protein [Propionicimonas sp.]